MDAQDSKSMDNVLSETFGTMCYADMVIYCSDGHVPIHRPILALASPFLRDILQVYNPIETHSIIIPDITVSIMKHVLNILYNGRTIAENKDEISEIVNVIKLLGIDFDCNPYASIVDQSHKKKWDISEVIVIYRQPPPTPVVEVSAQSSIQQPLHVKEGSIREASPSSKVHQGLTKEHETNDDIGDVPVQKFPSGTYVHTFPHKIRENLATTVSKNETERIRGGIGSNPVNKMKKIPWTNSVHQRSGGANTHQDKPTLKVKAQPTKKNHLRIVNAETAGVIQSMLESGQLRLAPGPTALTKVKTKSRSAFQDIPQNVVKKKINNQPAFIEREEPEFVDLTVRELESDESVVIAEEPVIVIGENIYNGDEFSNTSTQTFQLIEDGFEIGEEEESDSSLTGVQILDAAKVSCRQDHAYANLGLKARKRKFEDVPKLSNEKFPTTLFRKDADDLDGKG